jgi:type IV pilus assembly protein PilE
MCFHPPQYRCVRLETQMRGNAQHGFTLTELLITVVIVSILLSIAVPSYRQHIVRSKRAAAQSVMMDIANREQQFLLANRAYADKATLEASGYAPPAEVTENYTWDVAPGGGLAPSFVITFTGTGTQASDNTPQPLTLTSTGVKEPAEKWQR